VPQDKARSVRVADPALDVDAPHNSAIVHRALARLAPPDGLVLSLFYGAERSHKEIAGWLAVPVTTVARRLAHAKRRLQKHAPSPITARGGSNATASAGSRAWSCGVDLTQA
jgi:RNA polymerase sigma factor (sigma-70 family)